MEHPEGVWVLDGSDVSHAPGEERRCQESPTAVPAGGWGTGGQLPGGVRWPMSARSGGRRAIGGQAGLVSARELDPLDKDRCEAAGVPEDRQGYRYLKTELASSGRWWGAAPWSGADLKAGWVAADDAESGCRRPGPGRPGGQTVVPDVVRAGRSVRLYGVAAGALPGPVRRHQGFGVVPANHSGCETVSAGPWSSAATSLPEEAWREITVDRGKPGIHRQLPFQPPRPVRPTSRSQALGQIHPLGRLPAGTG